MKLYQEESDLVFATQQDDPFFGFLTKILFSEIKKTIQTLDRRGGNIRVLDLGCGTGRNVFLAAENGYEAVGVDITTKAIGIAKRQVNLRLLGKRAKFFCADITKLKKCQFGMFDYVILCEVIEHIENYQKVLDFAYTCLKPGGKLLLSTPNNPSYWTILDDFAQHVRRFTIPQVKHALGRFKTHKIFTVGFPLHLLSLLLYDRYRRILGKGHEPRLFRGYSFFAKVYPLIGSIVLRIDKMFQFIPKGDTIVAIATK